MKTMFKLLSLLVLTTSALQLVADSGKGKIRTAVLNVDANEVVRFKARPNISNSAYYNLVSKKTGIPRNDLYITYYGMELRDKNFSAKQLKRFNKHHPKASSGYRGVVHSALHPVQTTDNILDDIFHYRD